MCVASGRFAGRERGGLGAPHPSLAALPSAAVMAVSLPPRIRQRGKAKRPPILRVGKLRLPPSGYLHSYRPGVWTQAPADGLWVRTQCVVPQFPHLPHGDEV